MDQGQLSVIKEIIEEHRDEHDHGWLGRVLRAVWMRYGEVPAEALGVVTTELETPREKVDEELGRVEHERSRELWEIIEKYGRRRELLPKIVADAHAHCDINLGRCRGQIGEQIGEDVEEAERIDEEVAKLLGEQRGKVSERRKLGWFFTIIGSLFLLVSVVHLAAAISKRSDRLGSASWPTVEGEVHTSGVQTYVDSDHFEVSYVTVGYTYEVDGERLNSQTVSFSSPAGVSKWVGGCDPVEGPTDITWLYREREKAEEEAARYPHKSSVRVYHNPSNPKIAVLEPGDPPLLETLAALIFSLVIGLGLLIAGLIVFHVSKREPRAA